FGRGADVQPVLQMDSLTASQVTLSWLTFGASYKLQATANLDASSWQPVSGTATQVNGRWTQTISRGGDTEFYRLIRQ
ncbi:MAG: hypothetical protein NT154_09730, partial [Verrucomicrobia bacterium]|nr:hypothetical protein [Verrucomicrobiota bacterium]